MLYDGLAGKKAGENHFAHKAGNQMNEDEIAKLAAGVMHKGAGPVT